MAGIPKAANRATSVHPSFARAGRPTASMNAFAAGSASPGRAPPALSVTVKEAPSAIASAKTSRTCASAASSSRSGA
jgi:hypothetical protein